MTIISTFSSSSPATSRPVYNPNSIPDKSYVRVFDTTLRDGEQAPGATMTVDAKVDIARHLAKLGVDIIEAGFAASSKDDFEAVRRIALEVGNDFEGNQGHVPVICAFSRMVRSDIDTAWEAVRHAKRPRMKVFISTSDIHLKYKLNKTKDEVLKIVRDMVTYTKSLGAIDIQFSTEDSSRSEKEFLYKVYGEAIKAGATTIGMADTVGCQLPEEWGRFVSDMKSNVPGVKNVIISTHCHNDLGLATANTLAVCCECGCQAGGSNNQWHGERAGNASLEEVVMALKCRGEDQLRGLHTGINTKEIVTGSKMVEKYSGLKIQPHKAIVGANAFAHASGIHQDGMLKHRGTYEILSPEEIGLYRSNEDGIVLGKLSGRHALQSKLQEIGIQLDENKLGDVFWSFKEMAAKKKNFSNDDLLNLVKEMAQANQTSGLVDLKA